MSDGDCARRSASSLLTERNANSQRSLVRSAKDYWSQPITPSSDDERHSQFMTYTVTMPACTTRSSSSPAAHHPRIAITRSSFVSH